MTWGEYYKTLDKFEVLMSSQSREDDIYFHPDPRRSPHEEGQGCGLVRCYAVRAFTLCIMTTRLTIHRSVVCPISLMSQWESEAKKLTSGLRVVQHHGASRTTGMLRTIRTQAMLTPSFLRPERTGARAHCSHIVLSCDL